MRFVGRGSCPILSVLGSIRQHNPYCVATKFDNSIFYFCNTDTSLSLVGIENQLRKGILYSLRPSAVPEQVGLI